MSEGAGALYLKAAAENTAPVRLATITDPQPFVRGATRLQSIQAVRDELPPCCPKYLLCDSTQNIPTMDAAERAAWRDWTEDRLSPKSILGEGLAASSAWQCAVALDALAQGDYAAVNVSVVGCNQQAIGAHFIKGPGLTKHVPGESNAVNLAAPLRH